MLWSLDCETTGIDLYHGARPFFVTVCNQEGLQKWWEWSVDPVTRHVKIPKSDLEDIQDLIDEADELVLQNAKFDYTALRLAFEDAGLILRWDWGKVRDTLIAGHLLASNHRHDLTSMGIEYLGIDISKFERDLRTACMEARTIARRDYPKWMTSKEGLACMPSAKEKVWQFDYFLPALVYKATGDPEFESVLANYANADSATTVALHDRQMEIINQRGLEAIYQERLKVLPIAAEMEEVGVTISADRLAELESTYRDEAESCESRCIYLSDGKLDKLPKSGASNALKSVIFDHLNLPVINKTDKGNPSLDKETLESWLQILPPNEKPAAFIRNLKSYRKRTTALTYMEGYRRFWLPHECEGWYVLHPSLNPTGTDTLRWSSSNPNEQNIAKQEGFNLRYAFGPAPGREWWSLDAKNIELRIPAYEAGEEAFIELFEKPNDPPYFGSNHLLVAHILHPAEFEQCLRDGVSFKDRYKASKYQRVKNGNFAVQYGAVDKSDGTGTADRAYGLRGAQARIKERFKKQEELNQRWIRYAQQTGYVETMPDRTVDPDRGYPLLCSRNEYGKIKPTVPLNYHVQGTAMWWMMKAMIRVSKYLNALNKAAGRKVYLMVMQVHDELVFDFPSRKKIVDGKPVYGNLSKIKHIQELMEGGGDDIGVPTPVSIEYHEHNWSEGVSV